MFVWHIIITMYKCIAIYAHRQWWTYEAQILILSLIWCDIIYIIIIYLTSSAGSVELGRALLQCTCIKHYECCNLKPMQPQTFLSIILVHYYYHSTCAMYMGQLHKGLVRMISLYICYYGNNDVCNDICWEWRMVSFSFDNYYLEISSMPCFLVFLLFSLLINVMHVYTLF